LLTTRDDDNRGDKTAKQVVDDLISQISDSSSALRQNDLGNNVDSLVVIGGAYIASSSVSSAPSAIAAWSSMVIVAIAMMHVLIAAIINH
jgi:hypothetical protein